MSNVQKVAWLNLMPNPYAAENTRTLVSALFFLAVVSQFVETGVAIMLGLAVLWWLSSGGLRKPTSHSAIDASGNIVHHNGSALDEIRARQRAGAGGGGDASLPKLTAAQARASKQEKLR